MNHTITIDEGQRQMVLLALAHLAVERPGWDMATSEVALMIDNTTEGGRPQLFDDFKRIHSGTVDPGTMPNPGDFPPTCPTCGSDEAAKQPCADPWHDALLFDSIEAVCASYMQTALASAFPWLDGAEEPEPAEVMIGIRRLYKLLQGAPSPVPALGLIEGDPEPGIIVTSEMPIGDVRNFLRGGTERGS